MREILLLRRSCRRLSWFRGRRGGVAVPALEELTRETFEVAAEEFPLRERRGTWSVGDDWFWRFVHREPCQSDIAKRPWPTWSRPALQFDSCDYLNM